MIQKKIYLTFCLIGFAAPLLVGAGFLRQENPTIMNFIISVFANPAASAVATDLILSGLLFFVFVFAEGRRIGMNHLWIYVPAVLFIGLCFGLPLFLYNRARALERAAA